MDESRIVNCQARLLLFSAQISIFNSQGLNSGTKRSRADAIISVHHPPPTHRKLFTALSKSQFRNKRSRADAIISVHHQTPTHPKLFNADRWQIITLHQLTLIIIRLRSIFHLHQPKSNVPFPVSPVFATSGRE